MSKYGKSLVFFHPNKPRTVILDKEIGLTLRDISRKSQHESGGILLGQIYNQIIRITDITIPSKEDEYGSDFFIRSAARAQEKVNDIWKKSAGTKNYLGEWHSHPSANPIPSTQDREMIKGQLKAPDNKFDFSLLLIVGQRGAFWLGQKKQEKPDLVNFTPIKH